MRLLSNNNRMAYLHTKKEEVRRLRRVGKSLNQIARMANVPKSTLREWIKDILLTDEQNHKLAKDALAALQKGRKLAQAKREMTRNMQKNELFSQGFIEIGTLSKRELFIAGVALYWAEGFKNKHEKRLGFCNSDPKMIQFYLYWLKEVFGVSHEGITARLTINAEHKDRENNILEYWQKITGLSSTSFTKTFFQHAVSKKQFENRESYNGVLRLHVKESLDHILKMRGWIEGMGSAMQI